MQDVCPFLTNVNAEDYSLEVHIPIFKAMQLPDIENSTIIDWRDYFSNEKENYTSKSKHGNCLRNAEFIFNWAVALGGKADSVSITTVARKKRLKFKLHFDTIDNLDKFLGFNKNQFINNVLCTKLNAN